ncbi:MAG: PIN domain-containing protein [Epsilonproteobacteria bacterium]|nr:PIN domain-containing protein [Campylobacterota bacterium]
MKVLFDINVILDFFMEREPFFYDIKKIFEMVEDKKIKGYLCASSIDTVYYLIQKAYSKNCTNEAIKKLLYIFEITPVTKDVLLEALETNFNDFEDSVIYSSAYLYDQEIKKVLKTLKFWC